MAKIKIRTKKGVTEHEVEIPNKDLLENRIRYRPKVQKDKTKYTRRRKHRNKYDE